MAHSYLMIGLLLVALGLLAAALMPARRGAVLTAGGLAAPQGLSEPLFVPEYWTPVHLVGPWFSLEGVLFSFGNGCLIGAMVALRVPLRPLSASRRMLWPLARLTALMLLGLAVFLLSWRGGLGGLSVMHAVLLGLAVMLAVLSRTAGFRWRLAATAGLGFAGFYLLVTVVWHRLDPDLATFWLAEAGYLAHLPVPPLLPVEEALWAGLYGAVWASMLAFGLGTDRQQRHP